MHIYSYLSTYAIETPKAEIGRRRTVSFLCLLFNENLGERGRRMYPRHIIPRTHCTYYIIYNYPADKRVIKMPRRYCNSVRKRFQRRNFIRSIPQWITSIISICIITCIITRRIHAIIFLSLQTPFIPIIYTSTLCFQAIFSMLDIPRSQSIT